MAELVKLAGYKCFLTYSVEQDGEAVGAIQCKGPCWGLTADPNHRHTHWIAFIGTPAKDSKNLAGVHHGKDRAIEVVMEAHQRSLSLSLSKRG